MRNLVFNIFLLFIATIIINSCAKQSPISTFEVSPTDTPITHHPPVIVPAPVSYPAVIYFDTVMVYTDEPKDPSVWRGFTHHTFEIPAIDTIDTSHLKIWYKFNSGPYNQDSSYGELRNNNSEYSYNKDGSKLSVLIFILFNSYVTVTIRVQAFY